MTKPSKGESLTIREAALVAEARCAALEEAAALVEGIWRREDWYMPVVATRIRGLKLKEPEKC